jgi:hypothetical protein
VIDSSLIIGLVTSQSLGGSLLVDQGVAVLGGGRSIGVAGLDLVGRAGDETGIDGSSQTSRTEANGTTNSKERHCRRRGEGVGIGG